LTRVGEQGGDQPHHRLDPTGAEPAQRNAGSQHAKYNARSLFHRLVIATAIAPTIGPSIAGVFC
jgi:hypothetical protein